PRLVTVAVYVTCWPGFTVPGAPVRRRSRLGLRLRTQLLTCLSWCQWRGGVFETQPVSVSLPEPVVVTTMGTGALARDASAPRLQYTSWLPLQLPWLAAAETKVVCRGIRSRKPAPGALRRL